MKDTIIWTDSPSQLTNLDVYLLWLFSLVGFGVLIYIDPYWLGYFDGYIPTAMMGVIIILTIISLLRWLSCAYTVYELTEEELYMKTSFWLNNKDPLELYRIRDYKPRQPIWYRPFGLGDVLLVTTDHSHPYINLNAISKHEEITTKIRNLVEQCKVNKGVREVDVS